MKRFRKVIWYVLVIVLVLLLAGFLWIDHLAKAAVVYGANRALGVTTTLGSANIGVFRGKVTLKELNVSNPEDFKSSHFLNLGSGAVKVSLGSLTSDTVVVELLELSGIDVNLEKNGKGLTNYGEILENLKKLQSGQTEQTAPAKKGKQFIIKELVIKDVTAHADLLGFGGSATKLDVAVPEIRMQNVGSENKGAAMSEVTGVVLQAVMSAIVAKAGGILPKEMIGDLSKNLSGLQSLASQGIDVAGDMGKQIGSLGTDAINKIGDVTKGVGDVTKGLGDMFNSKPKNP